MHQHFPDYWNLFFPILLFLCLAMHKLSLILWLMHISQQHLNNQASVLLIIFYRKAPPVALLRQRSAERSQMPITCSDHHNTFLVNSCTVLTWLYPGDCVQAQRIQTSKKSVLFIPCTVISTLVFPIVKQHLKKISASYSLHSNFHTRVSYS